MNSFGNTSEKEPADSNQNILEDIDVNMNEADPFVTLGSLNPNLNETFFETSTQERNQLQRGARQLEEDSECLMSRATDPAWDEERRHYQKIVATFRQYG